MLDDYAVRGYSVDGACKTRTGKGEERMGVYLNPGNSLFRMDIESQIYVDKTELIKHTNRFIGSQQRFLCISRPRRFGKSMAANMFAAYY